MAAAAAMHWAPTDKPVGSLSGRVRGEVLALKQARALRETGRPLSAETPARVLLLTAKQSALFMWYN